MSIHVCKCERGGIIEFHLRYPGMTEAEAQNLADRINAGGLAAQPVADAVPDGFISYGAAAWLTMASPDGIIGTSLVKTATEDADIPVYLGTPAPAAVPLTEAQIAKALATAGLLPEDYREDGMIEPLVRAIEKAHGIAAVPGKGE